MGIAFRDLSVDRQVRALLWLERASGGIDQIPDMMAGDGSLPKLALYRIDKKAIVIRGRSGLDALADLLVSNGFGKRS